jgi:hypothetical protein
VTICHITFVFFARDSPWSYRCESLLEFRKDANKLTNRASAKTMPLKAWRELLDKKITETEHLVLLSLSKTTLGSQIKDDLAGPFLLVLVVLLA